MSELKPCPVCKVGEPEIRAVHLEDCTEYYAICKNCGAGIGHFDTEERAKSAWNLFDKILELDLEKYEVKNKKWPI